MLQSRATDETACAADPRAIHRRARLRGNYHFNAVASWAIDEKGRPPMSRLSFASPPCARRAADRGHADAPNLGRPVTPQDLACLGHQHPPDGAGLPPGKGTSAQGEAVFKANASPVMAKGRRQAERRAGRRPGSLAAGQAPVKTVGSYWPYATTLFDYIRRAMPYNEPKSLSNDEAYAVAAYILALNGVIGEPDDGLMRSRCPR